MAVKPRLLGVTSAAIAWVMVACSSAGAPGLSTAPFTPCLKADLNGRGLDQCAACAQASCAREGSAFQSRCAAYLECLCGDGQAATTATMTQCASHASDPGCAQAVGALQACEQTSCSALCASLTDGGGSDAAAPGDSAADADGGVATVAVSCSNGSGTSMQCALERVVPSAVAQAQQGCAEVGGSSGNTCPTQGLAGCCTLSTGENCYYDPSAAAQRQATCASAGGSWSTTP